MTLNTLAKAALFAALMGLASCAGNRGGAGDDMRFDGPGGSGSGAGGISSGVLGDPSDPRSPAYFQQTVGDRVLFPVDQSSLTSEARTILTAQARWLTQNPEVAVLIEGHADEQGTREYNIALSARRAESVRAFLVSQGVANTRLTTVPYGKERPAELCSQESCYAANRRAVTVLRLAGLS